MNAGIYVRVSTEQQAEKGYSIATQLEACRKYALELGANHIIEYKDEGCSGEFLDRPALTKMRQAIAAKMLDVVVIYDPDRLSRNIYHQGIIYEEIDRANIALKFVLINFDKSSDNMLLFNMRGVIAQYEKEKIKERTLRGKRGKVAKGMVISNAKPFGYTFDSQSSTYMINPAEAELVRMIFDFLVKEKMGTVRICKELNARGIPSPRAKKAWIVSTIHRILTNTIYKGVLYSMKYRYEKIGLNKKKRTMRPKSEWIPVPVPAIIAEETWQAAQRQLQDNKDVAKRNLKRDHLLSGIVTCAKCGRAMGIAHSGCKGYISYYVCLSKKSVSYGYDAPKRCFARQVPTQLVDQAVFCYLLQRYFNPARIAESIAAILDGTDIHKAKTALEQLMKTEKELLKQKTAVLRWFRQKMLTEKEAERQLNEIQEHLAEIAQMKKAYEAELAAASPALSTLAAADAVRQSLKNDDFTIEEKRIALRAVIKRVIIERMDNTRGRGSRPEINIQIELK